MSKRSGFAVKITAFIEADPTVMASMQKAMHNIEAMAATMSDVGFSGVKCDQRFMLSREVPDEPKAAQAVVESVTITSRGPGQPTDVVANLSDGQQLPIPPQFDRRKA